MTWHDSLPSPARRSPVDSASGNEDRGGHALDRPGPGNLSLPPSAASDTLHHRSLRTIVDVVQWRAAQHPEAPAFTFLADGETQEQRYSFGQLDRQARALAAELQRQGGTGKRALVVLEPGPAYITTLFGCLYAGVAPAPVYPPDPFRIARTLPRLQAIFGSAECDFLLSSQAVLGEPNSLLRQTCPHGAIAVETISDQLAEGWEAPRHEPASLALLQYTSGTTGEPRGVPISHANLIDNLRGMESILDVEDALAVQWLPPYHDLGLIGGVFLPLFANRPMVLMSPLDFMRRPARWLEAISRYRATTSAGPNFAYELCLRKIRDEDCQGLDLSSWKVAVSGAEPVRADTLDRFCERFEPYGFRREALVPAYGMAETTLMVSIAPVGVPPKEVTVDPVALSESRVAVKPDGRRVIGCGPAGPGVEVRVVDPATGLPTEGVGEVWVRGASVATGYWQKPELTAQRFDQCCGQQRGYFRTGDLGFQREGELFLVGRRKEMIILAGRNFYPHDLEQSLQAAHAGFKTDGGAAIAVEHNNQEQLVLLQEVQRPRKQDLEQLLTIARRVAAEETGQEPHRVILLPVGELPKTSSGKTRRTECWDQYRTNTLTVLAEWPAVGQVTEADEFEQPATKTEQWLAQVWCNALGVIEVGRNDSFFALGGRSLQVTEMLTQVAQRTGLTLPLATLFDHPTLAALAAHIELQPPVNGVSTNEVATVDFSQPQPLSAAQQRFWMVEQLGVPGGANVPVALRLAGKVDADRLDRAINELVDRHLALRLSFTTQDATPQQQLSTAKRISLERWVAEGETLEQILSNDWVWRPFDLNQPPLMRAALVDLADGEVALVLVVHHLVSDGASLDVLLRDLEALCDAKPLSPATGLRGQSFDDDKVSTDYWKKRLHDVPATVELPLEPTNSEAAVAIDSHPLSRDLCDQVDAKAAKLGVTPFTIYLSVMHLVLARYASQRHVGIGTAVANRQLEAPDAVGCFINTVPLFAEIDDDATYGQWIRQLQPKLLADLDHAYLPWEAIVEAADKARTPGRMPLVQSFFVHDDRTGSIERVAGAKVLDAATDYRGLGVFDLSVVVESRRPKPLVKLVHDRFRFPEPLAQRLLATYESVLQAVVENPSLQLSKVPLPAKAEHEVLQRGGEPTSRLPSASIVTQRLTSHAQQQPKAIAVQSSAACRTYAEVEQRATQVANQLVARGVGRGDRVGLLLSRLIDLPVAILGVWKAGAAYVPLDPRYPAARLAMVADDAELACLVTDTDAVPEAFVDSRVVRLAELLTGVPKQTALPTPSAEDAAYVMYTSGSTGKPKGVVVPHRAVANLLSSFAIDLALKPGHAMLGATTFAFDISVLELFLPLVTGATLVIANDDQASEAMPLQALLDQYPVSHLQGTPSWYRMLLSAGWRPTNEQTLLCGGEEVPADLAAKLLESAGAVWNVYGPTETTIWSTMHRIDHAAGSLPIGRPIAGTRCYVLDDHGRFSPTGAWGELVIAGAGVANGYWKRPGLTAERFPPDPFSASPARMYRTGDVARWNAQGLLEFGGRRDGQVKVRGHRIELREVELALASHEAVGEAAVIVSHQGQAEAALVAYVSPANGHACSPAVLLEHLSARLPGYMAPSAFIELPQIPKTNNGKIDRNRLPQNAGATSRSSTIVPPRSPLEQQLATWVCELLRIEQVGVFDNFFEIGGQSLLATQLVVRMRDEIGAEPPLREVYQRPTIAAWAELLLHIQLEQTDELPGDLLQQLNGMSDDDAAAFLESLANG